MVLPYILQKLHRKLPVPNILQKLRRMLPVLGLSLFFIVLYSSDNGIIISLTKFHSEYYQRPNELPVPQLSLAESLMRKNEGSSDVEATDYKWKLELYRRLDQVRAKCGVLCTLNSPESYSPYQVKVPGWDHWNMILIPGWNTPTSPLGRKQNTTQCRSFIGMEEADASDVTFPSVIPNELLPFYTLNETLPVTPYEEFFRSAYLESRTLNWSAEMITTKVKQALAGELIGTYGGSAIGSVELRQKLQHIPMKEARVLVIGSEDPWIEAICLSLGAAHVVTLEYSNIVSEHPQISTLTPSQLRSKYLEGQIELFDVIVTHSSVEHSGLGRYGDALNPWGDLLTVARAWCMTKPNGFMYIGVPTGLDGIEYNAHRIYGKYRWPLLTANWRPFLPDERNIFNLTGGTWRLGGHGFIFQKVEI